MSDEIKCNFCGEIIIHSLVIADGDNYCSVQCLEDWTSLDKQLRRDSMSETTTSIVGKCAHCGEKISCGSLFCSHECKENFDRRKQLDVLKHQYKSQKHEKIERMAWEMLNTLFSIWINSNCCENFKKFSRGDLMQYAFEVSEAFYDLAKEKEEKVNDD